MQRKLTTLAIVFAAFTAGAQTVETPPATAGGALIQSLVETARMDELRWPDFNDYRKHLRNLYGPIGYTDIWSKGNRVTPQARAIITLFESADVKGINAADYDGPRWKERLRALDTAPNEIALARFDLALSVTLMRYISDLHIGRINPRNLHFDLDIESKKYYLPARLMTEKDAVDPVASLADVEPRYEEYQRLLGALARYRKFADDAAADKPLPVVKTLKAGQPYPALAELARMLQRVGDLDPSLPVDTKSYKEPLVGAVKSFQARHGLEANGTIGAKTFTALNVPLSYRLRQIQWALERWRWAPMQFERPPIVVNVPEFTLRGWSDLTGKTGLAMRVVVGKAYTHSTPIFSDEMKYVVFRPYWNVPPSIQRGEIVPKLEKNPDYLAANNYEVVNNDGKSLGTSVTPAILDRLRSTALQVRQKAGGSNALGLVKFIFPNENNVYFHSTPSQQFFYQTRRDFSHGCIRVEKPELLASWVLRDQPDWTAERIKGAMNGKEDDRVVLLKERIPIMIIYATATVDEDGQVHFFDDIYGHDAALENALAAGYPYPV